MPKRLDRHKLLRNGHCPHDARVCSFADKKTKPCGFDWCARQAGTNAHDRIDVIEDKVNAIVAALSPPVPSLAETIPAPPEPEE